jgi:hypothetical protein
MTVTLNTITVILKYHNRYSVYDTIGQMHMWSIVPAAVKPCTEKWRMVHTYKNIHTERERERETEKQRNREKKRRWEFTQRESEKNRHIESPTAPLAYTRK